jgi:transcriptional regulator with PAS, ATPase and Fis domain
LSLAGFEDISNSVSASGVLQIYLDDNFDYKKTVKQYTESVERKIIQKAIEKFNGNKSKTAKFLNIDYKTILKKAKL